MVDWTDIPDRNRGKPYRPYKATVAPIRPGQDDRRSAYLRNQAIQNANTVRERRATVENPDWLGSRPANWYTQLDAQGEPSNWRAAKNVLQHIPAVTTDQNETRNVFQMLANQAKGGDKGARMLDTRGLPAGARRIGRTLFTDPAKSQGFFGDVGSLFTGRNKSAIRDVQEYNPFPKAGFAEDWYKDQFPWASALGNLTGLAEKSPTLSMIANLFPKKERVPLERDLSWVPEGVGEYDELPMMEFEDEVEDEEQTIQEQYNIPDFFPMSRDFAPEFTTADLPVTERFPNWETDSSVYENLDEVGFFDQYDTWQSPNTPPPGWTPTIVDEDITENLEEVVDGSTEEVVNDSTEELVFADGTSTGYNIKGEKIIEEAPTLTIEELQEKLASGEIEIKTGLFD